MANNKHKRLRVNAKLKLPHKRSLHSLNHSRIQYPNPVSRMDRPARGEEETEKEKAGDKETMGLPGRVRMEQLKSKRHDQRHEPVG
jgi:hypothetical protein